MCEQALGPLLDQIEYALEIFALPVIRIRHLNHAGSTSVVEQQLDACAMMRGRHRLQRLQIRAIHREDEIKIVEVVRLDGSSAQLRQIVASLQRCALAAGIRRIADVVTRRSGRIDQRNRVHALPGSQYAKYALSRGRPTNIS